MVSTIPTSVPVYTDLINDYDWVLALHPNRLQDDVTALCTILGMPGAAQSHNTSFLTVLQNLRFGCQANYNSTTTLDITPGQIIISNAGGTVRKLRSKSTTSGLTAASDMDSGTTFSASTRYYVYATADTATTAPIYKISTSSSAPSGFTCYRKVATFLTDGSANIVQDSVQNLTEEIDRLPKGYLYGGVISNSAGDPTNDLDVSACIARDTTDENTIKLGNTMTKQVDATFVAGTNQGGLDTGTIGASGAKVYVFLIGKTTDAAAADILLSKSSSPTMPSGWDIKRVLGVRYWDGAKFAKHFTIGTGVHKEVHLYDGITVLNAGTAGAFTDVDVSSYVDATYCRLIHVVVNSVSAGNSPGTGIRPNGSSEASAAVNYFNEADAFPGASNIRTRGAIVLDSAGVFEYINIGTSSTIYLRGYTEIL